MINLNAFMSALKCTWIRRFFRKDCKWQNVFLSHIDSKKFFSCGISYIKTLIPIVKNDFWKDVLKAWQMVVQREESDQWDFFSFKSSLE